MSYPHLFKKHWKTPFRDSQFNIRAFERTMTQEENTEHFISGIPDMSENPKIAGAQQPSHDELHVLEQSSLDSPEKLAELSAAFAAAPAQMQSIASNYSDYHGDLNAEYNHVYVQWRDRGATGFLNEPRTREIFVELEHWIENVIGEQQIREGKVHMYKGTTKKWQVLDDSAFDRDQVELLQAAVQAPLPDELEMYKEKHSVPMQLPFNNANATAWRDEARAIDSADFDPEFLKIDRERRKRFFIKRFEQPEQLHE